MLVGIRPLLALALVAAATLLGVPAPAVAVPTLGLSRMTVLPQVGGELVLAGRTSEPDLSGLSLESWGAGTGWRPTGLDLSATGSGSFDVVVPLDRPPLDVAGFQHFRLVSAPAGEQPATTSATLSAWVSAAPTTPFTSAPLPTVSGSATVGATLKATAGAWSPAPAGVGFRWNRDGVSTGVTGASYRLTAADLGARLTVTAVAFPKDGSPASYRDSRPGVAVAPGSFTGPPPEVVGRWAVGSELRAELTGWSPTPTAISYQWRRDGVDIAGATSARRLVDAADAGRALTVAVRAEAPGVAPRSVVSAAVHIPVPASAVEPTLGELMAPLSTTPVPAGGMTWSAGLSAPAWAATTRTRWDAPGAFTHSQVPKPLFTLASAMLAKDWARAAYGAEYPGTNPSLKNADVRFRVTGRHFAIAYQGTRAMDAMVWIDGHPIAAAPIPTRSTTETGHAANWITIDLGSRRTVTVRFAGPRSFTGVDAPSSENVVVTAAPPDLTVGVLSDSFFESCTEALCMSRSAAPMLSTLTGWGVWNFSESATGYLAPSYITGFGEYRPSVYGSPRRLQAIAAAPIDVLIVSGSANDVVWGAYSEESYRAAVTTFLDDVAALRPDLPVVLVGVEPLGVLQAKVWDDRARAQTAVLASMVGRRQNVIGFIDPYTDRWFTGTGSISAPKGDGNQDQYIGTDNAHPSVAGVAYFIGRIVDELEGIRLPQP